MKLRTLAVLSSLVAAGAAHETFEGRVAAQSGSRAVSDRSPQEWENELFRVRRLAIAPQTAAASPESGDSVLVFLTADLDGRMPAAEAVFQPRGARSLDNRAGTRFDAISIGLKDVPPSPIGGTPPEAMALADSTDVRIVIDNPRVTVLKTRYKSNGYSGPLHFHSKDTAVIYLGGGQTWPVDGAWGARHVTRGDIDLVPANMLHSFGNAGSDPLDVLVILPK